MRTAPLLLALSLTQACSNPAPALPPQAPATSAPATAPETVAPATAAPESAAPESAAAPATEAAPPVEPVKIAAVPTAEQQARADTLAGSILAANLNSLEARQSKNGMPFLFLAASHPRAEVVAAALWGMSRTWRRTGKGDAPPVDADFTAVVRTRLGATEPQIRGAALSAARLLVANEAPDEAALAVGLQLLKTGTDADRVAAAALVMNVRDFQLAHPAKGDVQARIVEALLAALQAPEPHVTVAILEKLGRGAFAEMPQRDVVKAAAEARLASEEPGIRGAAVLLLARLARPAEREAIARTLLPGLQHPSAFVRAATAEALGVLEFRAAAPGIVALLDVDAEATFTMGGFTALDGTPGQVEVLLGGGQRVDSVALNALRAATKKSFDFKGGVTTQSRDGLVAAAKAWLAANQAKLPKP